VSKDYGGMGFKNLQAFNLAMLGKQAWNLITKPESLITKLLKAKYFPKCDFFDSSIGHNPSFVGGAFGMQNLLFKEDTSGALALVTPLKCGNKIGSKKECHCLYQQIHITCKIM
jgi:hypothetical protein